MDHRPKLRDAGTARRHFNVRVKSLLSIESRIGPAVGLGNGDPVE
jgi:hypothetical protein